MVVFVEIEVDEQELRVIEVDVPTQETSLLPLLESVAAKSGIPVEELLLDLGVGDVQFEAHWNVSECLKHGHRWRHRRECVDLHFESEEARHDFPARATWAHVHKWGCNRFDVPHAACANLELHDGALSGPVLNDRKNIGHHSGCKTVWLVKPGPEPYGGGRR